MTLTDAGPLVALIDADEEDHARCRNALTQIARPLVTTWPAFTEAMYLLSRAGGVTGRDALWSLLLSGRLQIIELLDPDIKRAAALMGKYGDLPMDLADATLVAVAERLDTARIFTLDSDFEVYRLHGRRRFDLVPAPR